MLKLTQKQLDLLNRIAGYQPTADKPYLVISKNNKVYQGLVDLNLASVRVMANNALMLEIVLIENGLGVINGTLPYEVVEVADTDQSDDHSADLGLPFGKAPDNTAVQAEKETVQPTNKSVEPMPNNHQGYVIEKDVPIPNKKHIRSKKYDFPVDQMEVGNSFVVNIDPNVDPNKERKRVVVAVSQVKKRLGVSDHSYYVGIETPVTVRVWRTK